LSFQTKQCDQIGALMAPFVWRTFLCAPQPFVGFLGKQFDAGLDLGIDVKLHHSERRFGIEALA